VTGIEVISIHTCVSATRQTIRDGTASRGAYKLHTTRAAATGLFLHWDSQDHKPSEPCVNLSV